MARPRYQLVTTGDARPSDDLLEEVAARTGIADVTGNGGWLRRLLAWLRGGAPR